MTLAEYSAPNSPAPDGWYFKNPRDNTKINWYLPSYSLTMGDIEYLAFGYYPIVSSKTVSMPYFIVYTANGKKYTLDTFTRPTAKTLTYAYGSVSGSSTLTVPKIPGYNSVEITASNGSTGSSTWGTWSPTDRVAYFGFFAGTTDCSAGDIELILQEVNIITTTGTITHKYSNDSVINYYTAKQVSALYAYFFDVSSNIIAPPESDHSGFTSNGTLLYLASKNYGNSQVTTTYQAL